MRVSMWLPRILGELGERFTSERVNVNQSKVVFI